MKKGRKRDIYPTKTEIIKSGSIIYWENIEYGHFSDRENRLGVKVMCGICQKERWVPVRNIVKKYIGDLIYTGCCHSCKNKLPYSKKHSSQEYTKTMHYNGYINLYFGKNTGNIMCDKRGCILEHRYIMSNHIGRPLSRYEHVHHINGIKTDNRIENLELLNSSKHVLISRQQSRINQLEDFIRNNNLVTPPP